MVAVDGQHRVDERDECLDETVGVIRAQLPELGQALLALDVVVRGGCSW